MFALITPRPTSRGAKTLNSSTSRMSSLGGRYVPCSLGPRRSRLVYALCRARWERLYRAAGLSLTGSKLREPSRPSFPDLEPSSASWAVAIGYLRCPGKR
jgi:hypothetical protein